MSTKNIDLIVNQFDFVNNLGTKQCGKEGDPRHRRSIEQGQLPDST